MKKIIKKTISGLIALTMLFSLSVMAFAAETDVSAFVKGNDTNVAPQVAIQAESLFEYADSVSVRKRVNSKNSSQKYTELTGEIRDSNAISALVEQGVIDLGQYRTEKMCSRSRHVVK